MNCDFNFGCGFNWACTHVLPLVYNDSLSYYENICCLYGKIKELCEAVNKTSEQYAILAKAMAELKEYVDNYFTNLSVQEEINKKLDEMYAAGLFEGYFGNAKNFIGDAEPSAPVPYSTTHVKGDYTNNSVGKSNYTLNLEAEEENKFPYIRVATFNVAGLSALGEEPNLFKPGLLRKRIAQTKAAIVGLEETQPTPFCSDDFVYEDSYRKYVYVPDTRRPWFTELDNGFACSLPIIAPTQKIYDVQSPTGGENNNYVHASVSFEGHVISLYVTRLNWKGIQNADEYKAMEAQADELLAAMQADKSEYIMAFGDWNIHEDKPDWLGHDLLDRFKNAGFKLVNDGKYSTFGETASVDDIIVSYNIDIEEAGVFRAYLDKNKTYIDHSPLWAKLRLH